MNLLEKVHPQWLRILEKEKETLRRIEETLTRTTFYPNSESVMRAFESPLDEVRVVIFGQDPYPTPHHATGLAFSVPASTRPLPASLGNIFHELKSDIGGELRINGDLTDWASQGVALINRVLTIPVDHSAGKAISGGHSNLGWQAITNVVAQELASRAVIPILWGKYAQELRGLFLEDSIISSPHPSPLSAYRGFFGSRPFSKANQFLAEKSLREIDWL